MSGIVWKHEAPRLCRIRRALFGASPSAIFSCCALGLRHGCRACKGCEHNVAELMQEGFEAGMRRTQELHEPVEEAREPREKMKKYKLKKARPRGKLYRLEIVANFTNPPQDVGVPLTGNVVIQTDGGVHFGRLYPVKEEAPK